MSETLFGLPFPFIRKSRSGVHENFRRCSSGGGQGWARVNEGAEEGLRDYRREQSAKKKNARPPTYSLLEGTYISRPDKKWCPALCTLLLIH